jgi:hypothetical protein
MTLTLVADPYWLKSEGIHNAAEVMLPQTQHQAVERVWEQ